MFSIASRLRAGRSGVRIPVGVRDFCFLQNDRPYSEAHQVSWKQFNWFKSWNGEDARTCTHVPSQGLCFFWQEEGWNCYQRVIFFKIVCEYISVCGTTDQSNMVCVRGCSVIQWTLKTCIKFQWTMSKTIPYNMIPESKLPTTGQPLHGKSTQ